MIILYAGSTSQTIDVFIPDSSSTTGAGLSGLVYNSSGLKAYYRKGATGTATAITLATQTVGGAYSSGGFVEIDATNMKGVYRLDVPNAMIDTSGLVTLYLYGATNMAPVVARVDCRAVPADVKLFGGTAGTFASGRPEVNTTHLAGTSQTARDIGASVLLSSGTGTGQVTLTSGRVNADLTHIAAAAVSTSTAQLGVNVVNFGGSAGTFSSGRPEVNTSHWGGTAIASATVRSDLINIAGVAVSTSTAQLGVNVVNAAGTAWGSGAITAAAIADGAIDRATFAADTGLQTIRSGTAQTGGASNITLDASASSTTDFYKGRRIYLTGGTGAGQWGICTAYNGTSKVATIHSAWRTTPDNTTTFAVMSDAGADLQVIDTVALSTTTAQIGCNVVQVSGDSVAADNLEAAADGTGYNLGSGQIVAASVTGAVGSVTSSVTVGANNDKTGYSLTATTGLGNQTANITGSLSGSVGSVTGNVGGNVTGSVGSLATQAKADVNAEVLDVLATDTFTEPTGVVAATSSLKDKINWLFTLMRNKRTQTSDTETLYRDDGSTTTATSTKSDDGTTYTRGEWT